LFELSNLIYMTSPKIKIGCSGFYNPHWKKIFYPEMIPRNQWLNFYAQQFNTLEVNSTFYKYPTLSTLINWHEKTPDDFTFSVKAPKLITHLNRFSNCQELIDQFYLICEQGLKEKLGCLLFQLPPTIPYSEEKLDQILKCLKTEFINVIEFRHVSWWNNAVSKILSENNVIFCSVNHPKMPNTIFTNNKLYEFILQKKDLHEIYIYFNNTASNSGILNALELVQITKSKAK